MENLYRIAMKAEENYLNLFMFLTKNSKFLREHRVSRNCLK